MSVVIRLPKRQPFELKTGCHAGLFCVYLTAGKKRFLRFSEACDYYNLGLVHIRTIVKNLAVDMGKTRIRILCCISSKIYELDFISVHRIIFIQLIRKKI